MDTTFGTGGRHTSAGEGQRLGRARALLAARAVLLLDEPTAHIDPASSAQLLSEMLAVVDDRTVLVISHEPDIAQHVDEITEISNGSQPLTTGQR